MSRMAEMDRTIALLDFAQKRMQECLNQMVKPSKRRGLFLTMNRICFNEQFHSEYIAKLLSPNFIDFGQSIALQIFLSKLGIDAHSGLWAVETEHHHVVRRGGTRYTGRLDILVRGANHVIAIENKISAEEQDDQLNRYAQLLSEFGCPSGNAHLIYLTPFGGTPRSFNSNEFEGIQYHEWSYAKHVRDWMTECLNHLPADTPERVYLEDYREFSLAFWNMKTQSNGNSDMVNYILSNMVLEGAHAVMMAYQEAWIEVELKLWDNILDSLADHGILPSKNHPNYVSRNVISRNQYGSRGASTYGVPIIIKDFGRGDILEFWIEKDAGMRFALRGNRKKGYGGQDFVIQHDLNNLLHSTLHGWRFYTVPTIIGLHNSVTDINFIIPNALTFKLQDSKESLEVAQKITREAREWIDKLQAAFQ